VKLESITWRKPALVEITISQHEDPAAPASEPKLSAFTDFEATLHGSRVEVAEGVRRRFFTFRMARNIPMSPTDRQDSTNYQEQWGMNTVLGQEEIQRHPDFPKIRKRYNGNVVNEVVIWPRYIQDPDSEEKKIIKNPMFGVRSFLSPEVEVSVDIGYSLFPMDFEQMNEVGFVDTPSGFAYFSVAEDGANWILTEKTFTEAGIDRMERRAWRSRRLGWPTEVYAGGIQGANFSP
jgi:hypothetical protein